MFLRSQTCRVRDASLLKNRFANNVILMKIIIQTPLVTGKLG